MSNKFTIALPSKGAISTPTQDFLRDCGLKVRKPNPRQYTGTVPAIPSMGVLFQRVKDVMYKVADGTAQLGITGFDVVYENPDENLVIIHDKLGYGHCKLVVAVPESWADVQNMADLAEIAIEFREHKGRYIRIATTYPRSTREFLHRYGIHHFTIVRAEGAIEAAPTIGYADIIVDVTQTGTTLRENHLKTIDDGTIIESEACLIGNRDALCSMPDLMAAVRIFAEYIDASLNSGSYYQLTIDMQGTDAQDVAKKIASNAVTAGLLGPTISPIPSVVDGQKPGGYWHTVTIIISENDLLDAVDHVRKMGGRHVIVTPLKYIFLDHSPTYKRLLSQLSMDN